LKITNKRKYHDTPSSRNDPNPGSLKTIPNIYILMVIISRYFLSFSIPAG